MTPASPNLVDSDVPDPPPWDPGAGERAQQAAEAHLVAVWEAEQALDDALDAGLEDVDLPSSPASAPWDGCDTCTVREVLHAAWPILHDDVIAQLRSAGHQDAANYLAATRADRPQDPAP